MIKTSVLLNNIVTDLKTKTWTSPTSSKTTGFKDVVDFPNWTQVKGFPYLIVLDKPQGTNEEDSDFTRLANTTTIELSICGNYEVPQKNSASATITARDDKRQEAMRRIREAFDYLKGYITLDSTIATWISSPTVAYTDYESNWRMTEITFEDLEIPEFNLFVRRINLPLKDFIKIK